MSSQTRWVSALETVTNTGSGYFLSVLVGYWIYPAFGIDISLATNAGVTSTNECPNA